MGPGSAVHRRRGAALRPGHEGVFHQPRLNFQTTDTPSPSRGAFRPGFAFASRPVRGKGAGKAGRRLAPARLPCKNDAHARHRSSTGQPNIRPSLRSGLTAYACSPRRRVLSCLRHFRESHGRASVEATPHSRGLTVATTARTTRFCRTQASRSAPGRLRPRAWQASSAVRTTRLAGRSQGSAQSIAPPCVSHPRRRCPASTAARSAVRDDVRPPLVTRSGWGDNAINQKFCKGEYFGM
jgi:hypothetical protein